MAFLCVALAICLLFNFSNGQFSWVKWQAEKNAEQKFIRIKLLKFIFRVRDYFLLQYHTFVSVLRVLFSQPLPSPDNTPVREKTNPKPSPISLSQNYYEDRASCESNHGEWVQQSNSDGSSSGQGYCKCNTDYYGTNCDVYCVDRKGVYDSANRTCECNDNYVGKGCAFNRCPFGELDSQGECTCYSNAYSRGWYELLKCDVLRPIRCHIRLIDFDSDCIYDRDDANNKLIFGDTYCKTMDVGNPFTVKYWVECRMDATDITPNDPNGYTPALESSPNADYLEVVSDVEGVVLNVSKKIKIDISLQAINFGKIKNRKHVLNNATLDSTQLEYTIDSTRDVVTNVVEQTFTTPPLTGDILSPLMQASFPKHPFTNRLFVEIAGKVNLADMPGNFPLYGPESTTPIVVVNSKWIYLDFPSLPLPPKVYNRPSAFTVVIIVIGAIVGVLIILYIIYYIYTWNRDRKEEIALCAEKTPAKDRSQNLLKNEEELQEIKEEEEEEEEPDTDDIPVLLTNAVADDRT